MRCLAAFVVVAAVLLVAAALAWRAGGAPDPAVRAPAPRVSIALKEASIVLRQRGTRQAELRARRVSVSADLRTATFSEITQATVYDQAGNALHVRAAQIVLDRPTSDMRIRGPLVITSPRGIRLTAPEARWHHARQELIFPRGVQVRQGAQQLQAGRLVVDAALTRFELSGGVDIVFRLEGMRP